MSTTNLSDPRSQLVLAVSATLVGVSTVVVGLRLYTRCILLRTVGADDWTILLAQLMSLACSISTCIEAAHGLGRHIYVLSDQDIQVVFISLFITIFTYNLGLNIVKISFLLQYRRIFPNTTLRNICRWGLMIMPVWTIVQQVILCLTCTPLNLLVPSTKAWCLDTLSIWVSTSTLNLVTDFAIFVIPIPLIWDLQIPMRQKSIVFAIFGLGFFVCIISIIRVPTLRAAAGATDPTFDNISASLWTIAEINAAITCSSLSTLRPLFFRMTTNLTSIKRKTMTKSATNAPTNFPSSHMGHQLKDLSYKNTINNRVSRVGANDSSDDLVTATYDDMMYGHGLPGQSTTSDGRRKQSQGSFQTTRASDGDISLELGIQKPS